MPVDARIALAGRPAQIDAPDLAKTYALIQQLHGGQQQQQLGALQLQAAQQTQQDLAATKQAFAQYPGALTGDQAQRGQLLGQLGQASPSAAFQAQKAFAEGDKATREQQKAELEQRMKQVEFVTQVAGSAVDQPSYERGIALLRAQNIPTDHLPPVFDPNVVQQYRMMGGKRYEELKAIHDQLTLQETQRKNLATEQATQQKTAQEAAQEALRNAITVRGQDITATTAREGQATTLQAARENRAAQEANLGQVVPGEQGLVGVNTRTGVVTPITQGGVPVRGKMSETEGNALAYATRAQAAHQIALDLETKSVLPTPATEALKSLPLSMGNYFLPAAQQSRHQAILQFATAVLRKESGAAVSPREYKDTEETYFPQPGQKPEVIKQKQRARELAIAGLQAQTGGRLGPSTPGAGPAGPPPAGARRLTPEQARAWAAQYEDPEQALKDLLASGEFYVR